MYPLKSTKKVVLEQVEVEVSYSETPEEIRNTGHPDDTLPNVPSEREILSINLIENEELLAHIQEEIEKD